MFCSVPVCFTPSSCFQNILSSHLLLNFSGCFSRIRWKRWAMEASCRREQKRQHNLQDISKNLHIITACYRSNAKANVKRFYTWVKFNHPSQLEQAALHAKTRPSYIFVQWIKRKCLSQSQVILSTSVWLNGLCDLQFVVCPCLRESWLMHTVQFWTIATPFLL